jgi:AcrR family transcriptional regulator
MSSDARTQLLSRAVAYVTAHGVSGLSLRGLAAAIGTSHRMLIYHFGSMDGLLVEVVRHVEEQQRAALATLGPDSVRSPAEAIRAVWDRLADPALWPVERLFFELYSQALRGRPGTVRLLEGVVESWVDLTVDLAAGWGVPAEVARVHARLGVAVIRGLLLDLLATGDRAGADAAIAAFAAAYEQGLSGVQPRTPSADHATGPA